MSGRISECSPNNKKCFLDGTHPKYANSYFSKLGNWEKITTGPLILSYVEGYKIALLEILTQNTLPLPVLLKWLEVLVEKQIEKMLTKHQ